MKPPKETYWQEWLIWLRVERGFAEESAYFDLLAYTSDTQGWMKRNKFNSDLWSHGVVGVSAKGTKDLTC